MLSQLPIPLAGESLGSIILRAAEANGWPNPIRLVAAYLGERYASGIAASFTALLVNPERARKLASAMGLDAHELAERVYAVSSPAQGSVLTWRGVQVPRDHLRLENPAVCTQCLKTDLEPFARAVWDHRLAISCPTHKIRLIDQCPACSKAFSWARPGVCQCVCGFDLRSAGRSPASGAEHEIIERAVASADRALLDTAYRLSVCLKEWQAAGALADPDTDLAALATTLIAKPDDSPKWVRRAAEHTQGVSARIAVRHLLLGQSHSSNLARSFLEALESAGTQLVAGDWTSVLSVSITRPEAARTMGTSLPVAKHIWQAHAGAPAPMLVGLSLVDECLKRCLAAPAAQLRGLTLSRVSRVSAHKAFNRIVSQGEISAGYAVADGLRSLRTAFAPRPVELPPGTVRPSSVAKECGVVEDAIRFLCRKGFIESRFVSPQGKRIRVISQAAARVFTETYVFSGTLAKSVSADPYRFAERLFAAGIQAVSGPAVDGGVCYLFARKDLADVDLSAVARMRCHQNRWWTARSKHKRQLSPEAVPVPAAAKALSVSCKMIHSLISKGLLDRYERTRDGRMTRIRQSYVTCRSLTRLQDDMKNPAYIEIDQAATMFGESLVEFKTRWLLTDVVRKIDLGLKVVIPRSDLRKVAGLKERYMTSAEAAKTFGCYRGHLHNRFKMGLVNGTIEVGAGARTVRLYPRTQVTRACQDADPLSETQSCTAAPIRP